MSGKIIERKLIAVNIEKVNANANPFSKILVLLLVDEQKSEHHWIHMSTLELLVHHNGE